jgi:thiamine-phosphate pyrophosphorylase
VGLDELISVKEQVHIPLFGLGGVTSGNSRQIINCGADGISMISQIFGADDIQRASEAVIRATQKHER